NNLSRRSAVEMGNEGIALSALRRPCRFDYGSATGKPKAFFSPPTRRMEALQFAENKVREAIASPLSDGWKEPEAEKEEEKKPKLGGPTAAALETKVYEKIIGQSKEKLDLRLAKASIEIEKPAKHVFDIIWDV